MRPVRFYCESIEPMSVLDPVESNHLSRVLRLSVGVPVELFDGRGTLAQAIVERIGRSQVSLRVTDQSRTPAPDHGRVILAVSFAKGQRFDWLVEKCTELGADHIAAVQFERTVKLGKSASLNRLSKITVSAAKQCGRLILPELTGPTPFPESLTYLRERYPSHVLLYGSPDGQALSKLAHIPPAADRLVFIGPEGGFTEAETAALNALNAAAVCVNNNVLRVETAGVAFCALLAGQLTF